MSRSSGPAVSESGRPFCDVIRDIEFLLAQCAQEFMRAFQCFMYEFWDLETRELKDVLMDEDVKSHLMGGWCVLMPEDTRICHVRR